MAETHETREPMKKAKGKQDTSKVLESVTVISVSGCSLGRAASLISKRLLLGESIDVINAEKALVSVHSADDYDINSKRGTRDWGPFVPKTPELWFRRTIRGMVPSTITRGRLAMKRFRAYEGVPDKYESVSPEELTQVKRQMAAVHKYVTLKEYSLKYLKGVK